MRILVNGASGLIGNAVCARLSAGGHEIVAAVRSADSLAPRSANRVIVADMAKTDAAGWAAHLRDVDVVINCAGTLQDGPREDTQAVHAVGADALFAACEQSGIRRVIHFSAIGVDREQPSAFSVTKHRGDMMLKTRDLDWVILRPSVVLGRAVFGASALFRGLAALPVVPVMAGTGALQVVQLDDVTETVAKLAEQHEPAKVELELAGPERLSMEEIVARYRDWMGWKPARRWTVPDWLSRLLYRLGDLAGLLGWRPALRSTASKEIGRGAVGDPAPWTQATGIVPTSLAAALARGPATVQDRWFAKLFFLKPVILVILAGFWISTGIISLTIGYRIGLDLMIAAGTGALAAPGVIAGAVADLLIGVAIAWRPTARKGLWAAIALSLFYAVAGTVLLPELWKEPLGPLLKIWPILALHFVALAVLEER
jgi:uncharacterized protein YbjT (DUF2867 family)